MQPHDDRPLWDLLGRVPEASVSSQFANNVLRQIREETATGDTIGFRDWLARSWKIMTGLTTGAALLVAPIIYLQAPVSQSIAMKETPDVSALIAAVPISELAVLAEMDTTMDDNDVWLGSDSY